MGGHGVTTGAAEGLHELAVEVQVADGCDGALPRVNEDLLEITDERVTGVGTCTNTHTHIYHICRLRSAQIPLDLFLSHRT